MAKRKYWASVAGGGAASMALIFVLFGSLAGSGVITVYDHSKDSVCAGTEVDPCYATIKFSPNEDVYIYPTDYDPYGRNTSAIDFDKPLKDWKLQRSWGDGWRDIPLDEACSGTWCGAPSSDSDVTYSYAFREGRNYTVRIVGYKKKPSDKIKWTFGPNDEVDPAWENGAMFSGYPDNAKMGPGGSLTFNVTNLHGSSKKYTTPNNKKAQENGINFRFSKPGKVKSHKVQRRVTNYNLYNTSWTNLTDWNRTHLSYGTLANNGSGSYKYLRKSDYSNYWTSENVTQINSTNREWQTIQNTKNYGISSKESEKLRLDLDLEKPKCPDDNTVGGCSYEVKWSASFLGDFLDPTITVTNQGNWNRKNEANFNGTSADRDDNSGNLGIGYLNGTASDALDGFWRLDQTSGGASDYSGQGNDGTITGDPTRGIQGVFSTNGFDFDGSDDEVNLGDVETYDVEPFTITAWVKTSDGSSNIAVFSDVESSNGYEMSVNSGNVYLLFNGGTDLSGSSNVADGEWHFIAVTKTSGDNNTVWVDGNADGSNSDSTSIDNTAKSIIGGRSPGLGGNQFDGKIDEVKFYDEVLTKEELVEDYFRGRDGEFDGRYNRTINVNDTYQADTLKLDLTDRSDAQSDVNVTSNTTGCGYKYIDLLSGYNSYDISADFDAGCDVQIQGNFSSTDDTQTNEWDNFTVETSPVFTDSKPNFTLNKPKSGQALKSPGPHEFNITYQDDKDLVNGSLLGNWSGGWHVNATASMPGSQDTFNYTVFEKMISSPGKYKYSARVWDNNSQRVSGTTNKTFTVYNTISGFLKDDAGNLAAGNVTIQNYTPRIGSTAFSELADLSTNSTGGWNFNLSSCGDILVVGVNASTSYDGDADPHIEACR